MITAIKKQTRLPEKLSQCLLQLGDSLGRFDLSGQLQGLGSVKKRAEFELEQLRRNQDVRLRSYQTLGLCAGAALVILFV
jgi:stage III sporulation protein AB